MKKRYRISQIFDISRLYFKISREKSDPEKAVLPTIIFVNTNHETFGDIGNRGFVLCFGWWDFSVRAGLFL